MLASSTRVVNPCNIAQQGHDPSPTGSIKFRPGLRDHFIDDGDVSSEDRHKFTGRTLLSVNTDGIINHWNAVNGKL